MIESVGRAIQMKSIESTGYLRPAGSLINFDIEDQAIISSQAKMLNELEKFNSGEGNEIDLALATTMGEVQTEAAVNIIKTKDEMLDELLQLID